MAVAIDCPATRRYHASTIRRAAAHALASRA